MLNKAEINTLFAVRGAGGSIHHRSTFNTVKAAQWLTPAGTGVSVTSSALDELYLQKYLSAITTDKHNMPLAYRMTPKGHDFCADYHGGGHAS